MRLLVPLALLVVAAAPPLSLPGERHPTPTGDVWIERVSAGSGKPKEGVGRGVVAAPPERVFRALTDYAHWQEWMPFLQSSDARPQPDGSVLGEHAIDLPSPMGRRRYQVRFQQREETAPGGGRSWAIDWTFVKGSGNVNDHRGSWRLTDLGGGRTLAACRLYTDPGGLTPRWAMDRGTSQMLPWIFHGLRQQVRRSRYDRP